MSYIRMTQPGTYIDIPGGSKCYIYDNGNDISGWSYGEFAALIGSVVDEIDWAKERDNISTHSKGYISQKFADHFGGWNTGYDGGINRPERGEIFCQCVDRRIDSLTLTDQLQQSVQDWVDEKDYMRACTYCDSEFRPYFLNDETDYVCSDNKCSDKSSADMNGVTYQQEMRAQQLFHEVQKRENFNTALEAEWDYICHKSDIEDMENPLSEE